MNGVIVHSSVLLDVVEKDPDWCTWSSEQLERLGDDTPLYINSLIYTELSIGFETLEGVDAVLQELKLRMLEIPRAALFLAGTAFLNYRRLGGVKEAPLPDFFIGAHATVTGLLLLTRDTRRVARYFPDVPLIDPDQRPY